MRLPLHRKLLIFADLENEKTLKTSKNHMIVTFLSINVNFFFILYSELDHAMWLVLASLEIFFNERENDSEYFE